MFRGHLLEQQPIGIRWTYLLPRHARRIAQFENLRMTIGKKLSAAMPVADAGEAGERP